MDSDRDMGMGIVRRHHASPGLISKHLVDHVRCVLVAQKDSYMSVPRLDRTLSALESKLHADAAGGNASSGLAMLEVGDTRSDFAKIVHGNVFC